MQIMRNKRLLAVLTAVVIFTRPVQAKAEENPYPLEKHKTTFYCPESAGDITSTGKKVRYGICATDKAHLGMTAGIYSEDLTEFYGWFECEDTGGESVENGTIDIWLPSMESGIEWMKKTNGTVMVQFINAKG